MLARGENLPMKYPWGEHQSVNFGRHLTKILSPFEISYQIFIHTLPNYIFLSEIYLTKIVLLEILPYQFIFSNARKLYLIKVSEPTMLT